MSLAESSTGPEKSLQVKLSPELFGYLHYAGILLRSFSYTKRGKRMDFSVYKGKPVRITDLKGHICTGTAELLSRPLLSCPRSQEEPVLRVGSEEYSENQIKTIEFLPTYEEASEAIVPGRYRHFKGRKYEVLYVARHSETMEPLVVYRALYGDFGIWVRPASMWNETVTRDGKTRRRFEKVID